MLNFRCIFKVFFTSIFLIIFSLFTTKSVFAATITVTSNDNSGAGTLRQATYDVSDGDTINFNLGSGSETISVSSYISLPYGKDVTIDGNNTAGSGTNITIQVSSPSSSDYEAVRINSGANKTATLKNMTIRGGSKPTSSGATIYMYSSNASLVLENCTVKDGRARFGAGLWANGFNSLTITNCTFRDNNSTEHGGAARIDSFSGTVNITGSTFDNNDSTNRSGNVYGGTLYFQNNYLQGTVNIDKSSFLNSSVNISGGAIYSKNINTLNISNSTFYNNESFSSGGGLYAIYGTLNLSNSTFIGNTTRYSGGAIYLYGGTSTLTNLSIINNNSTNQTSDGLHQSTGILYLKNSILANQAGNDFTNSGGTINDSGYNIVESSNGYTWSGTGNLTGNQANLNISSALADNSTTYGTQTLALSTGSVAINAGNDSAHNGISVSSTDQRGLYRSSTTDIGAYEFGGLVTPVTHTLTYTANANGSITGTTPQTIVDGNDGSSVTAIPNSGYVFVNWSDNPTSNPRTDTNVTADIAVSANFQAETPPVITDVIATAGDDSTTITWATDEDSSSQVDYGLTSSYGSQTSETDTGTRISSHSVALSSLKSCSRYHYRVRSKDSYDTASVSTQKTFTTSGCDVSLIESGSELSITTVTGGEFQINNNNSIAKLNVPDGFSSENAEFQINRLATTGITTPTTMSLADENIFDLSAVNASNNSLTSFDKDLTFTVTYGSDTQSAFKESTLDVYRYNSETGVWDDKDCTLDTVANTLTCSLSTFSTYAVFGEETATNDSGSSSNSSSSSNSNEPSTPNCDDPIPGGTPDLFEIKTTKNSATIYFTPINHINDYYISYSSNESAQEHGALVSLSDKGVQNFTVNKLSSATKYYFKVRGQNGCMPGDWSNIAVNTTVGSKQSFGNLISKITGSNKNEDNTKKMEIISMDIEKDIETKDDSYQVEIKVDHLGKPLAGAKVELHSTPRYATTDENGIAKFNDVEGGNHTIKIAYDGYKTEQKLELSGDKKDISIKFEVEMKKQTIPTAVWAGVVVVLLGITSWLFFKKP